MLGLYVHIPFCARRCPYCDFAIVANAKSEFVENYVAALRVELASTLQSARANETRELSSIFFGGGTPSALKGEVLASLLELIRENFPIARDAEITLEANPEDATIEMLSTLRAAGWNRISFGAQSFDSNQLKFLGRRHDSAQVENSIESARAAGFENLSLDLIYALPGQTRAQWRSTLARAVELNVSHLSCYSLTIENGTNFGRRAKLGTLVPVESDAQAELMQDAQEILSAADYSRYEVSNYARPGLESSHNLNCWRGGDYLACGNSAHGHLNGVRWWNERDPQTYVALMEAGKSARAGEEILTPRERLDELVMLGLRTREGFDLQKVSSRLNLDVKRELNGALQDLLARGVLEAQDQTIRLCAASMPVADAVAARLLS